jgi:predicted branched-subunit amino acid permease
MGAEYWIGARAVMPLALAIGAVAVLFGYLATTAGVSPLGAVVMSGTTFAGSAQFAAVSVLATNGTVGAATSAASLLNARYIPMGAALAPALRGSAWKRFLMAQFVVDETWAVAYLGEGRFSPERLLGAGWVLYATHVSGTAVGAAAGDALGDPAGWGLDAAFPALFIILLWPHLGAASKRTAALLGAAIALALTPFTPPGIPLVGAAFASLIGVTTR